MAKDGKRAQNAKVSARQLHKKRQTVIPIGMYISMYK